MKLYKYGMIVGRFQTIHNGHKQMIETALELCDKVVIYVGSSQESGTYDNPFSYDFRLKMLALVFETEYLQKRLLIRPLPDIGAGNNDIWGRYVLGTFEAEFHKQPDVYITGCEKIRSSWFNNDIAPNVDELRLSRNTINVSASECRNLLKEGKEEEWKKLVPTEIYSEYDILRRVILSIKSLPKKWIYRFEHPDPKRGLWYNASAVFACSNKTLKQMDMPYEPDVYKGIYKSACDNPKDLTYWVSEETAKELIQDGFQCVKYLSDDYFMRDHGEICFNKTNYYKKEIVSLDELYRG